MCAIWFHGECLAIKEDSERGIWPCTDCRLMNVRIPTLTEAVQTLTTITREMSEKLETAEKHRKEDSKK